MQYCDVIALVLCARNSGIPVTETEIENRAYTSKTKKYKTEKRRKKYEKK